MKDYIKQAEGKYNPELEEDTLEYIKEKQAEREARLARKPKLNFAASLQSAIHDVVDLIDEELMTKLSEHTTVPFNGDNYLEIVSNRRDDCQYTYTIYTLSDRALHKFTVISPADDDTRLQAKLLELHMLGHSVMRIDRTEAYKVERSWVPNPALDTK